MVGTQICALHGCAGSNCGANADPDGFLHRDILRRIGGCVFEENLRGTLLRDKTDASGADGVDRVFCDEVRQQARAGKRVLHKLPCLAEIVRRGLHCLGAVVLQRLVLRRHLRMERVRLFLSSAGCPVVHVARREPVKVARHFQETESPGPDGTAEIAEHALVLVHDRRRIFRDGSGGPARCCHRFRRDFSRLIGLYRTWGVELRYGRLRNIDPLRFQERGFVVEHPREREILLALQLVVLLLKLRE